MDNINTVVSDMDDTPEIGSTSTVAPSSPSPDELTQVVATVGLSLRQPESWTAAIVESLRENYIPSLDVLLELYSSRCLSEDFNTVKALVMVNGKALPPTFWGLFLKELERKEKSLISDQPPAKRPALDTRSTSSASFSVQRTISSTGKDVLDCVYVTTARMTLCTCHV